MDDPNTEEVEKRRDFYNFATVVEDIVTALSNTVHAYMGDVNETLYKVKYEYEGEVPENAPAVPAETEYAEGASVGVALPVTIEGYEFSGWTIKEEQNGEAGDGTNSEAGGQTSGDTNGEAGEQTNGETGGQTGEGSNEETNGETSEVVKVEINEDGSFIMPARDVTLKGSFTQLTEKYKVTYVIDGEMPEGYVLPSEKEYYKGKVVTLDSLKEGDIIDGYKFLGWETNDVEITENVEKNEEGEEEDGDENSKKINEFVMPEKDVTITGNFELIKYSVEYRFYDTLLPPNSDNYLPETKKYAPGETVTLEEVEYVEGYQFLGWYKEDTFKMPERDVVIYGEWSQVFGTFEPKIEIEIINPKEHYEAGDVVEYKITVTNQNSFGIKDVIVSENSDNMEFKDEEVVENAEYKKESAKYASIESIEEKGKVCLYASYVVTDEDEGVIENEVEIIGALAENNYTLLDKDYKASCTFIVEKEKLVVHHYMEGTGEEYGTQPVRPLMQDGVTELEDEIVYGYAEQDYETHPSSQIHSRYKLVSNSENTSGKLAEDIIHVYYYYDYDSFGYSIHYFYNGVEKEVVNGEKTKYGGVITEYPDKSEGYVFDKVEPALSTDQTKANLVISENEEENIIKVYYIGYFDITTGVKEHEENYRDGTTQNIKGGTISGEGETPYESILYLNDSTKQIVITPNEGYKIAKVTITDEDTTGEGNEGSSITELDVDTFIAEDGTITLSASNNYFKSITSNKHVEVEFAKKSKVIVKYLSAIEEDENGKPLVLAEQEVIEGMQNDVYRAQRKAITKYVEAEITLDDGNKASVTYADVVGGVTKYTKYNENAENKMCADDTTIIYWYEKLDSGRIIVKHIEIDESDIRSGLTLNSGTELKTEVISIEELLEEARAQQALQNNSSSSNSGASSNNATSGGTSNSSSNSENSSETNGEDSESSSNEGSLSEGNNNSLSPQSSEENGNSAESNSGEGSEGANPTENGASGQNSSTAGGESGDGNEGASSTGSESEVGSGNESAGNNEGSTSGTSSSQNGTNGTNTGTNNSNANGVGENNTSQNSILSVTKEILRATFTDSETGRKLISVNGPESTNKNIIILGKDENTYTVTVVEEEENGIIEIRFYYERQYKITTEVKLHSEIIDGEEKNIKGGSITGNETINKMGSNANRIIATPDEGYKIKYIVVNGKEQNLENIVDENGVATIAKGFFTNIAEDKHIVVEFEKIREEEKEPEDEEKDEDEKQNEKEDDEKTKDSSSQDASNNKKAKNTPQSNSRKPVNTGSGGNGHVSVKTGDNVLIYMALVIIANVVIIVAFLWKRK
ncbi:MAG: InlB B-repeat-containing protein [Clostridia bacterium]|nr:InlB B-repeat-containing protein [Clostridia bacterium]